MFDCEPQHLRDLQGVQVPLEKRGFQSAKGCGNTSSCPRVKDQVHRQRAARVFDCAVECVSIGQSNQIDSARGVPHLRAQEVAPPSEASHPSAGGKINFRVCHSRPISTFYGTLNSEMSSWHNSCRGFAYRSARWFNGALFEGNWHSSGWLPLRMSVGATEASNRKPLARVSRFHECH